MGVEVTSIVFRERLVTFEAKVIGSPTQPQVMRMLGDEHV